MAIEIIPGEAAWTNLRHNHEGKWPTRARPDRLYPIATPSARPKFGITQRDALFCIGSCFAREVEQALKRLGFDVLSIVRNLPQSGRRNAADAGMFNKYTVAAIFNELRWALDPDSVYSDKDVLIENHEGLYEDYQLSGSNYADTLAEAQAFRAAFNASFSSIRQADVLVLTLGLSEAWFDRNTGLFLNVAPSQPLVRRYPDRFELHVFDYEETLVYLERIHGLLQTHCKPDLRILITVSPVPLLATFRAADVMVANAYSKAVLRAAVEKFASGRDNVSYFPSFEFVSNSAPQAVWGDVDFRHVDRYFVEHIMASVLTSYCEPSDTVRELAALSRASALYRARYYDEARAALLECMERGAPANPKLELRWAMIHRQLGDLSTARRFYESYLARCPEDTKALEAFQRLGGQGQG